MVKLSKKEIQKVADLAKISLTDTELEKFSHQLTSILDYVNKINEVDTKDIDFKTHVDLENVLREDEVEDSIPQKEAVAQGKNKKGYFVVSGLFKDET